MRAFFGVVWITGASATNSTAGYMFGISLILWAIHDRIHELKK